MRSRLRDLEGSMTMATKWKTPIRCPDCRSTAVRRRKLVFQTGTSTNSGTGSSGGLSFGLHRKPRPRSFIAGNSWSGKRQSLLVRYAAPIPFWPSLLIAFFTIGAIEPGSAPGTGVWAVWLVTALGFIAALQDRFDFHKEWLCGKCGASFIPPHENDNEHTRT